MELPDLLAFAPAPSRNRHAGWSAERQQRFVADLALGHPVGSAAARAGRSRQSAYRLRERPGAEHFAAAWDSALEAASARHRLPRQLKRFEHATDLLLVPRYYRGKLIGFVECEDDRHLLRRLHQLERWLGAKGDNRDKIDPSAKEICRFSGAARGTGDT